MQIFDRVHNRVPHGKFVVAGVLSALSNKLSAEDKEALSSYVGRKLISVGDEGKGDIHRDGSLLTHKADTPPTFSGAPIIGKIVVQDVNGNPVRRNGKIQTKLAIMGVHTGANLYPVQENILKILE